MPFIFDHNLLFIHIPKTGGSSIERKFGLDNFQHNSDICYSWTEEKIGDIVFAPQHYTPPMVAERYNNEYNNCKKFTIVRNPYTKIISEYFYRETVYDLSNLESFIDRIPLKWSDHTIPQKHYFENIDYDYVLRFENLNEEFSEMANDFSFSGDLPHHNPSRTGKNSSDYIKDLNKNCIQKINEIYHEDFEFLKYNMI